MNELVKCSRCKKAMIDEEFDDHNCSPALKGSKTILLDYYTKGKDEKGKEMLLAKGMDGIMYTFIVDNEASMPLSFDPSDKNLQGDANRRRFDRTRNNCSFIVPVMCIWRGAAGSSINGTLLCHPREMQD